MAWVALTAATPHIPAVHAQCQRSLSFVYSGDVGSLIANLVSRGWPASLTAVNLAFPAPMSLLSFLTELAAQLGVTDRVRFTTNHGSVAFYPSVQRGPVDTCLAERVLEWAPSTVRAAICATTQAYQNVCCA